MSKVSLVWRRGKPYIRIDTRPSARIRCAKKRLANRLREIHKHFTDSNTAGREGARLSHPEAIRVAIRDLIKNEGSLSKQHTTGITGRCRLLNPKEFSHISIVAVRNPKWLEPHEKEGFYLSTEFPIIDLELPAGFEDMTEKDLDTLKELLVSEFKTLGWRVLECSGEEG